MRKEWNCGDCCVYGTNACHYPSMEAHYIACEHLVVDHDYAYQQGRTYAIEEFVDALLPRLTDAIYRKDVPSVTNLILEISYKVKENEDGI